MSTWTERTAAEEKKLPHILLVDDDKLALASACQRLAAEGFKVTPMLFKEPESLARIVAVATCGEIDAVVTDWQGGIMFSSLHGSKGIEYGHRLVQDLKVAKFQGPIAVHSSVPDLQTECDMKCDGAIGLFHKQQPKALAAALKAKLPQHGAALV